MDVYDARGNLTGRVDHDGTVYNASGKYMGRVDHDGLVFNRYHSFVGQVQDNGIVCLANGEVMACVENRPNRPCLSFRSRCFSLPGGKHVPGLAFFLPSESS